MQVLSPVREGKGGDMSFLGVCGVCAPSQECGVKGLSLLQSLVLWSFGSLPPGLSVLHVYVCENTGVFYFF